MKETNASLPNLLCLGSLCILFSPLGEQSVSHKAQLIVNVWLAIVGELMGLLAAAQGREFMGNYDV